MASIRMKLLIKLIASMEGKLSINKSYEIGRNLLCRTLILKNMYLGIANIFYYLFHHRNFTATETKLMLTNTSAKVRKHEIIIIQCIVYLILRLKICLKICTPCLWVRRHINRLQSNKTNKMNWENQSSQTCENVKYNVISKRTPAANSVTLK